MEDAELQALTKVVEALDGLDPGPRARVLRYAGERYAFSAGVTSGAGGRDEVGGASESPSANFSDVGELVHATQASSGPERALAVAYWFQEIDARAGWSG